MSYPFPLPLLCYTASLIYFFEKKSLVINMTDPETWLFGLFVFCHIYKHFDFAVLSH